MRLNQGVALMGPNTTGPPWNDGRPTAHVPGPPAVLQTTTDASKQNNTGPLSRPVKYVMLTGWQACSGHS